MFSDKKKKHKQYYQIDIVYDEFIDDYFYTEELMIKVYNTERKIYIEPVILRTYEKTVSEEEEYEEYYEEEERYYEEEQYLEVSVWIEIYDYLIGEMPKIKEILNQFPDEMKKLYRLSLFLNLLEGVE